MGDFYILETGPFQLQPVSCLKKKKCQGTGLFTSVNEV